MKYKINWCENISGKGKSWLKATITDESGKEDEVSIWPDFPYFSEIKPGSEVEGQILVKGKYKNLVASSRALRPNYKSANIEAAQQRKAEMIKDAQERKNESVAYFNSLNSAIALLANRPQENAEKTKEFIIYWRDYFLSEWKKYEAQDYETKHNPF